MWSSLLKSGSLHCFSHAKSPMCECGSRAIENIDHFHLYCPMYDRQRAKLVREVDILGNGTGQCPTHTNTPPQLRLTYTYDGFCIPLLIPDSYRHSNINAHVQSISSAAKVSGVGKGIHFVLFSWCFFLGIIFCAKHNCMDF
jgi:hypothetical protein